MTDEEKKLKKRKIEQNRVKRQSSDVPFDPPPAKSLCLSAPGGEEEVCQSLSNRAQQSPPDPTIPQQVEKQAMMPHVASGADSTTYDLVGGEDEMTGVIQSSSNSNIDHSPSSSNSSSDVNVGYTAPASGMMTPLHMSQIEAAQLLTKSNSTSQNGQLTNQSSEMENQTMNSLLNHRPPPEFQSFHWQDESTNHIQQRQYQMSPAMMYPANRADRESIRASDLSSQIAIGAQSNKAMHCKMSYNLRDHDQGDHFPYSNFRTY